MVGADGLTLRRVIGEPSDSKCNSYFLPFLSTALQEMLEICRAAKFPSCLQNRADNSMNGTGRPSTLGLSLEFNSMRLMGSSYRLSSARRPFSPENETTWLSSAGSSSAIVKSARPRVLWKNATDLHRNSRPAILSVLHLPDIRANKSVSGSCRAISFATGHRRRPASAAAGNCLEFSLCCNDPARDGPAK